jgi:hypothetical protein
VTSARLRGAAFAAILAFEVLGPFYRHVLHGKNQVFRNWVMYRGVGLGLVDVRFVRHLPGGDEAPVDRFAALGYASPKEAPTEVWRIVGRDGLAQVTERLCREAPGDLRAHARLATNRGWEVLLDGGEALCSEVGP